MKRRRFMLPAAVLLAAAAAFLLLRGPAGSDAENIAANERVGVTRCLVIGTDRFVSMPDTGQCSVHNADEMEALLGDFFPEGTEITCRRNGPGTVEELDGLIREVFRDAGDQDVSLLYISTHGVVWTEGDEEHGALMLSDGESEDPLRAKQLRAMLDAVPGRKILVADACYSGFLLPVFQGPEYRVITSGSATEESYFWTAGNAEASGSGYFTAALIRALRGSRAEQVDPDGDGWVSLKELGVRLREVYGVSEVQIQPEGDGSPLFRLPEEKAPARVQGLSFDPPQQDGDALTIIFRFTVTESTRMEYQLVPAGKDGWDFEHTIRINDRERNGTFRGVLSPGDKTRRIRLSEKTMGTSGKVLLQIVSFRDLQGQIPVPEASLVIRGREETY